MSTPAYRSLQALDARLARVTELERQNAILASDVALQTERYIEAGRRQLQAEDERDAVLAQWDSVLAAARCVLANSGLITQFNEDVEVRRSVQYLLAVMATGDLADLTTLAPTPQGGGV